MYYKNQAIEHMQRILHPKMRELNSRIREEGTPSIKPQKVKTPKNQTLAVKVYRMKNLIT